MRKILLINPFDTEQDGFSNQPLGLLYLAGTLFKHGFEVKVVDGCLDGISAVSKAIYDFHPQIVGVTCLTPARKKAFEVAKMAKLIDKQILVILGGAHPTIMHQQIMEHYLFVDYIVLGEGEECFLEIVQGKEPSQIAGLVYRDKSKVIKTAVRQYVNDLDSIPFPAYHLVDLKRYPARGKGIFRGIDLSREPRISVVFSRGCTGHCDFCSTWWIWKGWRCRSPKNMVDEIELLYKVYGVRHFCFSDDALTADKTAAIGLCDEIIARNLIIAFHVTTRTDCVDAVVLRKLKEAGCYTIAFGVETGSPLILKKMGKENDVSVSEQAILMCKEIGLKVVALLIVGNVGENDATINDTIHFLKRTQPDEIGCVGGLWVLPGTALYQQCKREGTINDEFWLSDEPYMLYTEEHSRFQLARMVRRVMSFRPLHQRIINRFMGGLAK